MSKSEYEIDQEVEFNINELFVSKTDKKGLIKFGNQVFSRISGYSNEELVGRPHNIVRHSDMPKSVFKLLWDTIKTDQPIAAYVKNKAKNGAYYWVLATVIPVEEGFFSIRLKPSSSIFEQIPGLYKEMLSLEKNKGLAEAQEFLNKTLLERGFKNYNDFMATALNAELLSRSQQLCELSSINRLSYDSQLNSFKQLKEQVEITTEVMSRNNKLIDSLGRLRGQLGLKVDKLISLSFKMNPIATNMSISAHRIGREGSTLAVVAGQMQTNLKSISTLIDTFRKLSIEVEKESSLISFGLSASQLQAEMISQFLIEVSQLKKNDIDSSVQQVEELFKTLIGLFSINTLKMDEFNKKVNKISMISREFSDRITKLSLIYSGGRLESSRSLEIANKFKPFLIEFNLMTAELEKPSEALNTQLEELVQLTESAFRNSQKTEFALNEGLRVLSYQTKASKGLAYVS